MNYAMHIIMLSLNWLYTLVLSFYGVEHNTVSQLLLYSSLLLGMATLKLKCIET